MDHQAIYQEYISSLPTIPQMTADLRLIFPQARYILDEIDHREGLLQARMVNHDTLLNEIKSVRQDVNEIVYDLRKLLGSISLVSTKNF